MKTQKIISIKTVATAMLVATLLTFAACSSRDVKSTKEKGQASDSRTTPKPPKTDIHTASLMGDLKAIQQHIKAGSDLNEKDEYGSTPLIIAATFGKDEIARALIDAGADMNCRNNDGSTPLHVAAFLCRTEIVKMLLENGADKNLQNNFGSTALESVAGPFENVKGVYDQFSKDLGPLGLKLDYQYIKATRPGIAEMLK
jgi:ankyrin repeat protein